MKLEYKTAHYELKYPFGISRDVTHSVRRVMTKLSYKHNGKTYFGYSEAVPSKYYGETPESVLAFYQWVEEEKILDHTPFEIATINEKLSKMGRNYAAKAGIDCAIYDLIGKIYNVPAYKYLGFNKTLPKTSYTIDISDLEMILKKTGDALISGYDILKVKVGTRIDEEIIFSVRQAAPDVTIRVDANAAWSLKTALKMMKVLEKYNIEFVEQPLDQNNFKDLSILREATTVPIIADESCVTCDDVIKLYGLVDGINLKIAKNGGITNALKMLHTARSCNMKVMVGCFLESSLSIAAATIVGTQADYIDLDGSLLLKEDPFKLIEYDRCHLKIAEIPGIAPDDLF